MSSSSSPSEPDSESDSIVRYIRGTACSRSFAAHAPNVSVNMKGNSRSRSRSLLLPPFPRQSATTSIEGVHESQSTAPRRESAAPTRSRHSSRASAAAGHCLPLLSAPRTKCVVSSSGSASYPHTQARIVPLLRKPPHGHQHPHMTAKMESPASFASSDRRRCFNHLSVGFIALKSPLDDDFLRAFSWRSATQRLMTALADLDRRRARRLNPAGSSSSDSEPLSGSLSEPGSQ